MKKLVSESLHEFVNEASVKKTRKTKAGSTVTLDQGKIEKAQEAIKGLKAQLADMKKGAPRNSSKAQDESKKKDIQAKIDKWQEKIDNAKK